MGVTFYKPINNAFATLTQNHLVDDGVLVVDTPGVFGVPSSSSPLKVVANNGQGFVIYRIISISGNRLNIDSMVEGTEDIVLPKGTVVDVRMTAADLIDIQNAILTNVGVGDLTYVHSQITPSSSWTINHDLGKFPSVSVVDSGGTIVMGDVNYLSINSLVVSFTASFGGSAYLN